MLLHGIINPAINALLDACAIPIPSFFRYAGFPTYRASRRSIFRDSGCAAGGDVLRAVRMNFRCGKAVMSAEFPRYMELPSCAA